MQSSVQLGHVHTAPQGQMEQLALSTEHLQLQHNQYLSSFVWGQLSEICAFKGQSRFPSGEWHLNEVSEGVKAKGKHHPQRDTEKKNEKCTFSCFRPLLAITFRGQALFTEQILSLTFLNCVDKSSMNCLSLIPGNQSVLLDTLILWDSLLVHEAVHNET